MFRSFSSYHKAKDEAITAAATRATHPAGETVSALIQEPLDDYEEEEHSTVTIMAPFDEAASSVLITKSKSKDDDDVGVVVALDIHAKDDNGDEEDQELFLGNQTNDKPTSSSLATNTNDMSTFHVAPRPPPSTNSDHSMQVSELSIMDENELENELALMFEQPLNETAKDERSNMAIKGDPQVNVPPTKVVVKESSTTLKDDDYDDGGAKDNESLNDPLHADKEAKSNKKSSVGFMSKLWSSIGGSNIVKSDKLQPETVDETTESKAPAAAAATSTPAEPLAVMEPTLRGENTDEQQVVNEECSKSDAFDHHDEGDNTDAFNPFINIGNRLLDSEQDVSQDDDNDNDDDGTDSSANASCSTCKTLLVCKQVTVLVGETMMVLLRGLIKGVGICARNFKPASLMLLGCALGIFLGRHLSYNAWHGSVVQEKHGVSVWNSSMMGELTPPSIATANRSSSKSLPIVNLHCVDDSHEEKDGNAQGDGRFESMIRDFCSLLKVMALSTTFSVMAGLSVARMHDPPERSEDDAAPTPSSYSKHEDDRSRYDNLNVKELKEKLLARNLCTTGIRSHLVDRLVNDDNGGNDAIVGEHLDVDVEVVKRNTTVKAVQDKLRSRNLPVTGLKEDLIVKVWIPARVKELKAVKHEELRELLKTNKLSEHGKSNGELIRRLVEAGH